MIEPIVRWVGTGLLFLVVTLCIAITVIPPFLDDIYYTGPKSDHFDGQRFFNPDGEDTLRPPGGGNRGSFIWRYLTGNDERPVWPTRVNVSPGYPPAEATPCPVMRARTAENWKRCVDTPDPNRMFVTWIGHSTFLIQTQGLNILTDPVYGDVAGPYGVGPRRVAVPGIAFDDLPKIDLVIVSHNHYDHYDIDTLERLWKRDRPKIVVSLGNETLMKRRGIEAIARDWGGRVPIRPGVDAIVTRNHHWGSRWFTDRNRALWSSFVITLPGGNIFFGGDTGMGDGKWPAEAAALGPVRLALIPIGAFRFVPGQMGVGSHIGPVDAAEVFARLGATRGIGMHWGTFRLSYEAWDTPPKLLAAVMKCRGMTGFGTVAIGRPAEIAPYAPPVTKRPLDPECLDTDAVRALK
ncbi:MAG: MBL fold metallo-hydrolase [Sphingomonadaceae bacterium]